jgi:HEAT repeat protein
LSVWLRECYDANDDEAPNAIRAIGTNALPALLELARTKDSSGKKALLKLASRQSRFAFEGASEAHDVAMRGYAILGPAAAEAVPALTDLLSDPDLQLSAIGCLSHIGAGAEDAVPALILQVTNTNYVVGACAKAALATIHGRPEQVVPALIANLTARPSCDPTPHLTVEALGRFGEEANAAVPSIVPLLTDGRLLLRAAATNALKRIDPEAARRAGVK